MKKKGLLILLCLALVLVVLPLMAGCDEEEEVANPSISVDKTETSTGPYDIGDTVTYSYTVTNNGDVTLTDVSLSDDDVGIVTLNKTTLSPGQTATGTAQYTVEEADAQAGEIVNVATASGDDPDGVTYTDTDEETAEIKVYKVCITQIATHPDLDSNRQGIIDAMEEEGFFEGGNVEFIIRNAEGDMTAAATIADLFVSEDPDLIHAITTPSAQTVVAAAEGTDIPIIFSSVTDPVAAGLVPSWEEADPYVTGVSDWFEMTPQVEFILEVLPDIDTLGTAYNPGEVNAQVQADILKEIAPDYGLTVVEATAASTADVLAAGMSLVGQCDAVWIPTCNTVGGVGISSIIQVGEDNDLPIFGSAKGMIETGLVGGVSVDYYGIGKEAGYMAARILRGESMADIPPMKMAMSTIVYPAAAARMGITIPQAVIDAADILVED